MRPASGRGSETAVRPVRLRRSVFCVRPASGRGSETAVRPVRPRRCVFCVRRTGRNGLDAADRGSGPGATDRSIVFMEI